MKNIKTGILIASVFCLTTFSLQAQNEAVYPKTTYPKIREVGIGLSNFNSFSMQYHWGTEKRLFRLSGFLSGSASNGTGTGDSHLQEDTSIANSTITTKTTTPVNFSSTLSFSVLHLNTVSDKFGFMWGPMVAFGYSVHQQTTEQTQNGTNTGSPTNPTSFSTTKENFHSLHPSLGIVLGAFYKINSSFLLYAEVDPNIYYSYTTSKTSTDVTTNYYGYNNPGTYVSSINNVSPLNTFGIANLSNSGASITIAYRWLSAVR